MRRFAWLLLAAAGWITGGCSSPDKPEAAPVRKPAAVEVPAPPPKITQMYTTTPTLPHGEKGLLCYGVENATAVWLAPPRRELSAALARCVEVEPAVTTTYTLTAEGTGGKSVTRQLTVTVGAPAKPRVRIIDVTVSALSVRRGDAVSICYNVENAAAVQVDPIHFRAGPEAKGCAMDQPQETTTYTITAKGADSQDTEHVTVKVQ